MRYMLDSLHPLEIPLSTPLTTLIAAYVDNSSNPNSIQQALTRFPNHTIVSISSEARLPATFLDVERGATSPSDKPDIVRWVNEQANPIVYATADNWKIVGGYFSPDNEPQWWEANWNGQQTITDGTMGHQYANSNSAVPIGAYDSSVILDYVKGIDMSQPLTAAETTAALAEVQVVGPGNNQATAELFPWVMNHLWETCDAILAKIIPAPPVGIPATGIYTYDSVTGAFTFAPMPPTAPEGA